MNVITTKLSLSESKGLTLKARHIFSGNSVVIQSNPSLDPKENHMAAAVALANKMQWQGTMQGGMAEDGFVWVLANDYLKVEV